MLPDMPGAPAPTAPAPAPYQPSSDEYWAGKPKAELVDELVERAKNYYDGMDSRGLFSRMREAYAAYYGTRNSGGVGSPLRRGGDSGEVLRFSANHFRNIVQHMLTTVTGSRPAVQARPVNMDPESLAQALSAQAILEYFWREKRLDRRYRKAVEVALVCGRGYVHQVWDVSKGEAYDVDPMTGQVTAEGDVSCDVLTPFDVIKAHDRDFDDLDWVIVRLRRNKYDLAAKYPDYAEEIMAAQTWIDASRHTLYERDAGSRHKIDKDVTYEYVFYHRSTPALPGGRLTTFAGPHACLTDGPLPYERIPLYSIAPAELLDTSDGYSGVWDLISIQDALDIILSAAVSNLNAFGHQRVIMEEGCQVQRDELTGGVTLITVPAGTKIPPTGIQLTQMPQDWATAADMMVRTLETLSGVNSVSRGNPEASLKSGSALALVQAQTVQFLNALMEAHTHLLEDGMTGLVNILKAFAKTPRMALIAGDDKRPLLESWSGADVAKVSRVVVDVGNALSQTLTGRVEQATWLKDLMATAQPGMDVQQSFAKVVQVATSGKLEPMVDDAQKSMILIRGENRLLRDGTPVQELPDPMMPGATYQDTPLVPTMPTDNDVLHIQGHAAELNDPELRQNPDVMTGYSAHIMMHVRNMRTRDPALAAVLGLPSLAMPVMGPPGAEPGGEPTDGPPGSEKVDGGQPAQPKMPKMPQAPGMNGANPGGRPVGS